MSLFVQVAGFGAAHGFSTRSGGVSAGPYGSLNLGAHVGDDPAAVGENRRRLLAQAGARQVAVLDQVHGDEVLSLDRGRDDLQPVGTADAAVTRTPGLALCIGSADCLPVLLWAPDVGWVGAAHAGWKGARLRIAARTARTLQDRGARPGRLQVALGPCIRRCCYEVGAELAAQFEQAFGPTVVDRTRATPHLDLVEATRIGLLEQGVRAEAIVDLGRCTHCEASHFFSHRRDRGTTGRMLSFLMIT